MNQGQHPNPYPPEHRPGEHPAIAPSRQAPAGAMPPAQVNSGLTHQGAALPQPLRQPQEQQYLAEPPPGQPQTQLWNPAAPPNSQQYAGGGRQAAERPPVRRGPAGGQLLPQPPHARPEHHSSRAQRSLQKQRSRLEQPLSPTELQRRTAIARRYRHELDEDFVPDFGPAPGQGTRFVPQQSAGARGAGYDTAGTRAAPARHAAQLAALGLGRSPTAAAWATSTPTINWQNWPIANGRFWTALGGIAFAAIMLNVLGSSPVISSIVKSRNRQCQEVVQPSSVLSRQQLTQLLAVPERSPKAKVEEIIQEPYCILPSISIRAGVSSTREAYPLEFDPETWIILLYEGDEYAGYRFDAR